MMRAFIFTQRQAQLVVSALRGPKATSESTRLAAAIETFYDGTRHTKAAQEAFIPLPLGMERPANEKN